MDTRQNRLIEAILVGVRNPRNGKRIYIKFSTTVKIASILVHRRISETSTFLILIYNKNMHYIHKNARLDL